MKKTLQTYSSLFLILFACCSIAGQSEPVIFGTVTHSNGESVTGTIRWGDDEESVLSDVFNFTKLKTNGIDHLSAEELKFLEDKQPGPKAQIGDIQITFKSFFGKELKLPLFKVAFGAIKRIDIKDGMFTVTLHDGNTIQTDEDTSDSNDTSDDIYVKTTEGETLEFDIEDLDSIVFSAAPADAKTFGDGIYGIVSSEIGTFKGRIMWDKDERTLTEELDGNDESQDHEIKFSEIKSLEKINDGKATLVTLRGGKTLTLTGTNDVNNGNRGIRIDNPTLGRLEINWQQFKKLNIENVDVDWLTYEDYVDQAKVLSGIITLTNNKQIKADSIIFDLNQQSQAELLEVNIDGSNRLIPMLLVKTITRKNSNAVELIMRDQSTKLAYGNRSVTDENHGLLVTNKGETKWYQWSEIKAIELD